MEILNWLFCTRYHLHFPLSSTLSVTSFGVTTFATSPHRHVYFPLTYTLHVASRASRTLALLNLPSLPILPITVRLDVLSCRWADVDVQSSKRNAICIDVFCRTYNLLCCKSLLKVLFLFVFANSLATARQTYIDIKE